MVGGERSEPPSRRQPACPSAPRWSGATEGHCGVRSEAEHAYVLPTGQDVGVRSTHDQ